MRNITTSLFPIFFRYCFGAIIIWLGIIKFRNDQVIHLSKLLHDSIFYWITNIITPFILSQIIGYLNIGIGVLLLTKIVSKKLSLYGGLGALIISITNIALLVSSSKIWETGYGFPELSLSGQILVKDVVLAGVALWCINDSK